MWNIPGKDVLDKIPRLYETEDIPAEDKIIYLHFFMAACDWYIAEYDGNDLFFGFAILNMDSHMAEWGYISFKELRQVKVWGIEIDCEIEWEQVHAGDIEKIRRSMDFGKG